MTEIDERDVKALHAAIGHVLATDDGRLVLFWLLELCGLYQDGFTGEDNLTNYRLGRQSIAKQILATMNAIDGGLYPRFLLQMAAIREREQEQIKEMQDE